MKSTHKGKLSTARSENYGKDTKKDDFAGSLRLKYQDILRIPLR